MPIYAFECADCGHSFDRLQKLSDPDPTECPSCAGPGVRRQLTGAYSRAVLRPMAETLAALGSERAWLVHGTDGAALTYLLMAPLIAGVGSMAISAAYSCSSIVRPVSSPMAAAAIEHAAPISA